MKWDSETMKPGVFYMTEEAYEWFRKEYARLYNYFVYILTDLNEKIYIGYGKGDTERRWVNGKEYNHNATLKAAIAEYGRHSAAYELFNPGRRCIRCHQREDCDFRQFLLRGQKKGTTEILFLAMAYNTNKLQAKIQRNRTGTQLFEKDTA